MEKSNFFWRKTYLKSYIFDYIHCCYQKSAKNFFFKIFDKLQKMDLFTQNLKHE